MLAELAFRITAQGAYAREFGNLRKEVAQLDAGMSTIARTARITQLSLGALGSAFVGGLGARAIVSAWRMVKESVEAARTGATDFGGRVTADMIPSLNAAASAFNGIENAIGGAVAAVAAGAAKLATVVGLLDGEAARLAAKYGRDINDDGAAALKELQDALAAKATREGGESKSFQTGNIFDLAGQRDLDKALEARAEAARQSLSLAREQATAISSVNSALDDQIAKLGMSAEQQRVYDELQAAGVTATSAAGQAIAAKVHTLIAYQDALAATNARLQEFRSFAGSALNAFTGALQQGKSIAEAFRDSWVSALGTIINKINEAAAAALASSLFGGAGPGAGVGGLLTSIGSFLGFAGGGSFIVGGAGGPDSQLVPLKLTPGEVVNVSKGEGSQSQRPVEVVVKVEGSKYFDAHVANVSAPVAQRAAISAVGAYDKATRRGRETTG